MLGSIIDVLRLAFFLVEFNHILAVFFFFFAKFDTFVLQVCEVGFIV